MSIHPSLRLGDKLKGFRSILSRVERIKWMMEQGLWQDNTRPFNLPKIKVVKMKISKKSKKQEAQESQQTK